MGVKHGSGVLNVRRSPEIVWDESGGEVVLINLESGVYFSLNGSASEIWIQCLVAPQLRELSVRNGIELGPFFDTLMEYGLATLSPPPTPTIVGEMHEVSEQPIIDVYSDLAEMLLLDPIHDVDSELGWPNPSPND